MYNSRTSYPDYSDEEKSYQSLEYKIDLPEFTYDISLSDYSTNSNDIDEIIDNIEVDKINVKYSKTQIKPFFTLEFISVFLVSILINNINLLIIILTDNTIHKHILKIIFNNLIIGTILYIFSSPSTIRSINITTEYTYINAIIFNYNLIITIKYILIQFIASFMGNIFSFLCNYKLLNKIKYNIIIIEDDDISIYGIYSIISLILFVGINTFITDEINSINYTKSIIKKILVSIFINLIFIYNSIEINISIYEITGYLSYKIIKNSLSTIDNIFLIYCINSILHIIIIPILTLYFNYKVKPLYKQYIEY
jgi:hypothetical protein